MSTTVIALATTLVIILVLAVVVISLLCIRTRRKPTDTRGPINMSSPMTPGFGLFCVSPSHPAAQISPFGSNPQRPIFHHEPGKNMRVAHRREDGGWEFSHSELPRNKSFPRPPESVYSTDSGSPISPARSASSVWTQPYPLSKTQESKVHANSPGLIIPPPPAYSLEDSVSIDSQP